jgi:hypothetical protein
MAKAKKVFGVAICKCGHRNQVVGIRNEYGEFNFQYSWFCQQCNNLLTHEMIENK